MMMKRTKIVCTIGPSVNDLDSILALIRAGMDVARVNFSHGDYERHLETIEILKEARIISRTPLAIMLDTKGPEIRIGKIKNDVFPVEKGHKLYLVGEDIEGDDKEIPITPSSVLGDIREGMNVLFHDGYVSSRVLENTGSKVLVEIENKGELESRKGVNIPNAILNLPAMTDQDISDIRFGCRQDIDIIAASFIRSANHVMAIRELLKEEGKSEIKILAKIENTEGVQNFDNILRVADGIMIARGDMGVEMPLSQVPRLQKMMIRKTYLAGKPSVTATQMLESMIHYPRPTRAEVSDVANAIYDSTSAVMLSGETAVGRYSIQAVKVMRSIIEEAEKNFDFRDFFRRNSQQVYNDVPSSVTLATVKTAYSSNATAIFAFTKSGSTGRLLSRFRPKMPIIALTPNQKCYHQMALNWGVCPIFDSEDYNNVRQAHEALSAASLDRGLVKYGDLIVLTAGSPFGIPGTTNSMIVENIGKVLVRGQASYGKRVYGKVMFLFALEEVNHNEVKDHIIVIPKCNYSYLPFLMKSKGVILENHVEDNESEQHVLKCAEELNIPALVRADGAFTTLHEGQNVTLDPSQLLVFRGAVEESESGQ